MVRKKIIIFVIISIIIITFCHYFLVKENSDIQKKELVMVDELSTFEDFVIKDDKVFFRCYITVKNISNNDRKFKLRGDFFIDTIKYKGKSLVKQRYLYAIQEGGDSIFEIKSNSEKSYRVIFKGDFAGKRSKVNRNMPKIKIEVCK